MTQEERTRISRDLILEGAIREFSRHGYEDASINRICADNGISKGRLFHHFKNKEDIFLAAAQACMEGMADHTAGFHPDPQKPLEHNFHDYFNCRQQYFIEHAYHAVLLGSPCMQRPSEKFRERIWRLREYFEKINLEKLQEIFAHSAQTIAAADSDLLLQAFHVASYFIHLHVGSPNWNPEKDMRTVTDHSLKVFDKVVHMLLYGILPRQDGPAPPENGAEIYWYLSGAAKREAEGSVGLFGGAKEELL